MGRAAQITELAHVYSAMSQVLLDCEKAAAAAGAALGAANTNAAAFTSALTTVFDLQGMINAGYRTGSQAGGGARETTTAEHDEDIARRFENLENELKTAFGQDNFAAASIDNVVKSLRAGVLTPNQAMEVVRGVLGAYFTGGQLFGDLGSPDAAIRHVAEEMMRLLNGGTLNA